MTIDIIHSMFLFNFSPSPVFSRTLIPSIHLDQLCNSNYLYDDKYNCSSLIIERSLTFTIIFLFPWDGKISSFFRCDSSLLSIKTSLLNSPLLILPFFLFSLPLPPSPPPSLLPLISSLEIIPLYLFFPYSSSTPSFLTMFILIIISSSFSISFTFLHWRSSSLISSSFSRHFSPPDTLLNIPFVPFFSRISIYSWSNWSILLSYTVLLLDYPNIRYSLKNILALFILLCSIKILSLPFSFLLHFLTKDKKEGRVVAFRLLRTNLWIHFGLYSIHFFLISLFEIFLLLLTLPFFALRNCLKHLSSSLISTIFSFSHISLFSEFYLIYSQRLILQQPPPLE